MYILQLFNFIMIKNYLFVLVLVFGTHAGYVFPQGCESEYVDSCKKHLKEDHFTFLKSFSLRNAHGEHQKFEYSFPLIKGKKYEYYFEGYREGDQDVIATLYNSKHKKIATSVHHKELEHKLVYACNEAGIYYIEFTFKDDQEYCGSASLGFSTN